MDTFIELNPEVSQALNAGSPVVALESTIITHGMPFPDNLVTARAVEQEVRNAGATPATIAVMDGKLKIGLIDQALESLAQQTSALKLSRADLAVAISARVTGSTTVAATMIAANLAKIQFFATGGIGGVHRGVEITMDISADLSELARTSVTVVCAGAKAILDLPKTLEYLETAGVPVVSYQTDELPAFWSRSSGLRSPLRMNTVTDISRFIRIRQSLELGGGLLIANPVPEPDEIPRAQIENWMDEALRMAGEDNISGKAVTPYLLSTMNALSQGATLTTNIALIKNNARLAAELAVEHKLEPSTI